MKYELTTETETVNGVTLHRIRAERDIKLGERVIVRAGELGGWVESERNLSQRGEAWVYGEARVYGEAWVYGDARVSGNARVLGEAWVYGGAKLFGSASVCGGAHLRYGSARAPLTLRKTIAMSLGIKPSRAGIYRFYKKVFESGGRFFTDYEGKITDYPIGGVVEVKDYDPDPTHSCAPGLHLADKDYNFQGNATLLCAVREEDIICCLDGKVRVKRLEVLGVAR
jgi:hypothetical protein